MNYLRTLVVTLLLATVGCTMPQINGEEAAFPEDEIGFLFYTENEEGEAGDLYVKATEYVQTETGKQVLLVPMVHIGSASFYSDVERALSDCDVVLEESVNGVPSLSPYFALMPYVMGNMRRQASLSGLSHQAETLNADDRWINGDVTVRELQGFGRWHTPITQALLFPLIVAVNEVSTLSGWLSSLACGLFGGREAYRFHSRDDMATTLAEPGNGALEVLIPGVLGKRNDRLLEVLDEVAQRDGVTRIGVPWGAAHLSGISAGLTERGYEEKSQQWLRVLPVRQLAQRGASSESRPTDIYIPYVLHYRAHESTWYTSLLFRSILLEQRTSDEFRFSLLWKGLLAYSSSGDEASSFQVLPSVFGRPLLFRYQQSEGASHFQFLWFFRF